MGKNTSEFTWCHDCPHPVRCEAAKGCELGRELMIGPRPVEHLGEQTPTDTLRANLTEQNIRQHEINTRSQQAEEVCAPIAKMFTHLRTSGVSQEILEGIFRLGWMAGVLFTMEDHDRYSGRPALPCEKEPL